MASAQMALFNISIPGYEKADLRSSLPEEESWRRDVALLRLNLESIDRKRIGDRNIVEKLSCAALVLQRFIQRASQLSGTTIELAGQQVIFLFQDVVFVGDIQRG
jgi:hypothetical protein